MFVIRILAIVSCAHARARPFRGPVHNTLHLTRSPSVSAGNLDSRTGAEILDFMRRAVREHGRIGADRRRRGDIDRNDFARRQLCSEPRMNRGGKLQRLRN